MPGTPQYVAVAASPGPLGCSMSRAGRSVVDYRRFTEGEAGQGLSGFNFGLSSGSMPSEGDPMSPKINVSCPTTSLPRSKTAGVPVSAVCQQALADAVAASQVWTSRVAPSRPRPPWRKLHQTRVRRAGRRGKGGRVGRGEPTTVHLVAALGPPAARARACFGRRHRADDVDDELRRERAGRASPATWSRSPNARSSRPPAWATPTSGPSTCCSPSPRDRRVSWPMRPCGTWG